MPGTLLEAANRNGAFLFIRHFCIIDTCGDLHFSVVSKRGAAVKATRTDEGTRDLRIICEVDVFRKFKAACSLADVSMSKKLQEYMSVFIVEILGPPTAKPDATRGQ
jgi:hypothetical protein